MKRSASFSRLAIAGLCLSSLLPLPRAAAAEVPDPAGIELFEKHIRPVLVKNCFNCHAGAERARGGLRLDTKLGGLIGGESGPAIVPGKPEESPLITALKHEGSKMPPSGKLPDEVISHFEEWITRGAPDPRVDEVVAVSGKRTIDFEAGRQHWAFQPLRSTNPPQVQTQDWPRTRVDHFILSRLEQAGLKPASDVDRATWLRRVSFSLIGLPPSSEEILAFEQDQQPGAFERVVDRLLSLPQFGERWARHWFDVARYAESTGKERNFPYLQAWRYRDYVIDSLNNDKPYNQFVREQIAGDLLPATDEAHKDQLKIATGFLALGPKGINERNREAFLLDIVDEQIDSVGRAILATSISCARCHDHKFDPIPTADYYAIAGIFRSTETRAGVLNRQRYSSEPDQMVALSSATTGASSDDTAARVGELKQMEKNWEKKRNEVRKLRQANRAKQATPATATAAVATSESAVDTSAKTVATPEQSATAQTGPTQNSPAPTAVQTSQAGLTVPEPSQPIVLTEAVPVSAVAPESTPFPPPPALPQEIAESSTATVVDELPLREKELASLDREITEKRRDLAKTTMSTFALAVVDREKPADIPIRVRGEVDKLGPVVPRGLLTVLSSGDNVHFTTAGSGRVELADWIASRDNPLTARVFVNRVWAKLFGAGLVSTVDDFGTQGQAPTHPELLDDLASGFIENGWSTKWLIRHIVLAHAFQVGDQADSINAEVDGENKLLWKWNRRRLEAEAIRDGLLAVSGQLDSTRPVGTPVVELGVREIAGQAKLDPIKRNYPYRSVYLPIVRNQLPEALALFDLPDPGLITGQRDQTTGPSQALYMLNGPLVERSAEELARRVLTSAESSDSSRVEQTFITVLGRRPVSAERELSLKFLDDFAASDTAGQSPDDSAEGRRNKAWVALLRTLLASPEFRYLF